MTAAVPPHPPASPLAPASPPEPASLPVPASPPPPVSPIADWLTAAWAQAATVHAVEVEGATTRYRAWGEAGADRPGLILVHGFLAHARWWDHVAPSFTDRYRVAAPDFTGMGDSDRRPVYSRRQYGRELLAVARDTGMARVTLVAHSFGSVSALYAASLAPDLVERVVIIDAHVFRGEVEGTVPVEPERFYATAEEARARYRLLPPGTRPDPAIVDHIARTSMRETAQGWSWKFDPETFRTVHRERIRDDIRNLPVPVDFIHAGDSEIVGAAELAAFRANMPTCGAPVTVPHSHHHIMIEQPLALIAALNGLFAQPRHPAAHDR